MKIGEIATASGISRRMIRHYESTGLIKPAGRRDSGYRDYDEQDLETLRFIGLALDVGFSSDEVQELLRLWQDKEKSPEDVMHHVLLHEEAIARKGAALEKLRLALARLAKASAHGDRLETPIVD